MKIELPTDVLDSIGSIVDYNWADEASDYAVEHDPDEPDETHIFTHLQRVATWLDSLPEKCYNTGT